MRGTRRQSGQTGLSQISFGGSAGGGGGRVGVASGPATGLTPIASGGHLNTVAGFRPGFRPGFFPQFPFFQPFIQPTFIQTYYPQQSRCVTMPKCYGQYIITTDVYGNDTICCR